jgi:uncharacterized membrane protein
MDKYKNSDADNKDKGGEYVHHPEFVLLEKETDDTHEERSKTSEDEYYQAFRRLHGLQSPWSLRFLILLGSIVAVVALFIVLFFFLVSVVVAGFALFRNPVLNAHMKKSWKNFKKILVILVGFTIALFSPELGLSFIVLYFMTQGDNLHQGVVSNLFKSSFFSQK